MRMHYSFFLFVVLVVVVSAPLQGVGVNPSSADSDSTRIRRCHASHSSVYYDAYYFLFLVRIIISSSVRSPPPTSCSAAPMGIQVEPAGIIILLIGIINITRMIMYIVSFPYSFSY